jgi:hypothetical protein
MSEVDMNYDEFLLLLAILLSNSNADGLSPIGRKKLYNQSIHYSKALQKLLQYKFGSMGHVQKSASIIGLINLAIRLKYKFLFLYSYMEVFYAKKAVNYAFPKIMQSE